MLLSCCGGMRAASSSLPALMVQRLNWMDEVAEAKRAKGLPITDPKREAELLRAMTQRGVAAGLPAEKVRLFFTGQLQAAKMRQEEWLRQHPTATMKQAPDLPGTIRPALDEIGRKMIEQMAQSHSLAENTAIMNEAQLLLTDAGFSEAVMKPALEGLQAGLDAHKP